MVVKEQTLNIAKRDGNRATRFLCGPLLTVSDCLALAFGGARVVRQLSRRQRRGQSRRAQLSKQEEHSRVGVVVDMNKALALMSLAMVSERLTVGRVTETHTVKEGA